MHQQNRRQEDHTVAARVANSPYANIAHLATTILLLTTILGFGANFWADARSAARDTERLSETSTHLQKKTANLSTKMSSVKSAVERNREDIKRVETQAAQDRREILKRLQTVSDNLNELNRYLRNKRQD